MNKMGNVSYGPSGVHETIHNVPTHKYRVKKTVTPAVRLKIAQNRRFKRFASRQHKSF